MANEALTTNVLNYSGVLRTKSDDTTRFLDAIFTRGKKRGRGITSTGVRKVNSIEFDLSSPFTIGEGSQPAITEEGSLSAAFSAPITRNQEKNNIQIFQDAVAVSYLKQSAVGTLAGLNIAGQESNVQNEFDFQVAGKLAQMKKSLNFTALNGVKQESSGSTNAWKSGGLINGIVTNAATYTGTINTKTFNAAIVEAMKHGFVFAGGNMELWVNPADLEKINDAYKGETGFGLPQSRTEGGLAITTIMTSFGMINVDYDATIPVGTYLLVNMGEMAIAELDVPEKGNWFVEKLDKKGAGISGQIYGQAGIDYGAEWSHIKFTAGA